MLVDCSKEIHQKTEMAVTNGRLLDSWNQQMVIGGGSEPTSNQLIGSTNKLVKVLWGNTM